MTLLRIDSRFERVIIRQIRVRSEVMTRFGSELATCDQISTDEQRQVFPRPAVCRAAPAALGDTAVRNEIFIRPSTPIGGRSTRPPRLPADQ